MVGANLELEARRRSCDSGLWRGSQRLVTVLVSWRRLAVESRMMVLMVDEVGVVWNVALFARDLRRGWVVTTGAASFCS